MPVTGEVRSFREPGKLVSYLGLDPRVHQSGEREAFTGHISRSEQAHARGLLVEAAHAAVASSVPLRAFCSLTERRRGTQVAVVAVARKLAVLSRYLITTGEGYRYERTTVVRQQRGPLARTLGKKTERRWRAPGEPSLEVLRARELATLAEAEAGYKAEVATRAAKDAAAANWVRL